MTLKVLSIVLLQGFGPDQLDLELQLPNGQWPYDGNAMATIKVAAGQGVEYCRKQFPGVPLETIRGSEAW